MAKDDWVHYLKIASVYYEEKNYTAAIDALNKSISLNKYWNTYQGLGWAYSKINEFPKAIDAFNQSLSSHKHWESYQGLGWAHFLTSDFEEAINAFNKSLSLCEHWESYQGLGWAHARSNNFPEAIDGFTKSLSLKRDWNTYQHLGWTYYMTNNFPEAINAFNNSIALNEHWEPYQGLGLALMQAKNYSAAIDAFNKSISINEHWNTYDHLCLAFYYSKNYLSALHALINSKIINRSKNKEKLFHEICSRAINDNSISHELALFAKCSANNIKHWAQTYLKRYILISAKASRIDPLLLRQASFLIRSENVQSTTPRDEELLDFLNELTIQKNIDMPDISGFHRYFFGVSHSSLHIASPHTTVTICGAGTMFSIANPNSRTKHFQQILYSLETIDPKNSVLFFEFGEVDIRRHVFKVSRKKSQSFVSIADKSISRYIEFLQFIKSKGYIIVVCGPHCGGGRCDQEIGSVVERNDLCAYVNDALSLECLKNGFFFLTLFDKVVNQSTYREILGFYRDHHHLCIPPSEIGIALSDLFDKRVEFIFSQGKSQHTFLQREEVISDCSILSSDIPGWKTGDEFIPGEAVSSQKDQFKQGKYILLVELPFLMHLKEVTLEFDNSILGLKTAVQGVLEPWGICFEQKSDNILHAVPGLGVGFSRSNFITHSFEFRNKDEEMCRFLVVMISVAAEGNRLVKANIKRWVH